MVVAAISLNLEKFDTDKRPETYDPGTDHWKIENLQRNAIDDACRTYSENDLLMISDVDEIPRREAVELVLGDPARVLKSPLAFQQFLFYYSLRRLRREDWRGTVITTVGQSRKLSAQWHRNNAHTLPYLASGGWHLSYFGGTARIQAKLESFAHQEFNTSAFKLTDHIGGAAAVGADLFHRAVETKAVDGDFFPAYFLEAAERDREFFFC